jgi:ElaA protein
VEWTWSQLAGLSALDVHALLALRQRAFVVEQRCAYQDADEGDLSAWHLLGVEAGALVAYLRVGFREPAREGAALSRIVVAPGARGRGLGRAVVREGMRRAREACGAGPLRLEAQSHLVDFYRSLGFAVSGDEYRIDGIPHTPMRNDG